MEVYGSQHMLHASSLPFGMSVAIVLLWDSLLQRMKGSTGLVKGQLVIAYVRERATSTT